MKKPELIMPAGNLEKLKTAYSFGADACYLGLSDFSLRYRENQITEKDLLEACRLSKKLNKKLYITLNLYPHNEKIPKIIKHIKFLKKINPDAIIFSDPGIYRLLKIYYKNASLHLSVQATATNFETVNFWKELGIKRVILARELSLKEIKEIHKKVPNIELECFVHGAICMAYSGRCLLSNYMTGRDANQGDCAHSCRWNYKLYGYALKENLRKNDFYEIYENDHGSHILSSRDLCMIENLKEMVDSGITSFKVEGRSKNTFYVATIAKAYHNAINDMIKKKKFDKKLLNDVMSVSNRGFFKGFYFNKPSVHDQQLDANRTDGSYQFIGKINKKIKNNYYAVTVKNYIKNFDNVEIISPSNIKSDKIIAIYSKNKKSKISEFHAGVKDEITLKLDKNHSAGDIIRKKVDKIK